MPTFFWDASALVKRYTEEIGSATVDSLFRLQVSLGTNSRETMVTTVWGYAETFAILVPRRNDNRIDQPTFSTATALLKSEVITGSQFAFLDVDDSAIIASLPLIQKHHLNSADAALLFVLLRYSGVKTPQSSPVILVSADKPSCAQRNRRGCKRSTRKQFPRTRRLMCCSLVNRTDR